jgi:hypothetical protein
MINIRKTAKELSKCKGQQESFKEAGLVTEGKCWQEEILC